MTVTCMLLGLVMLFSNVYGYKRWLEPKEISQQKLNESMNVLDSLIPNPNWLFLIITFVVGTIPLTFYFSSAIYFSANEYLLAYGILQFLLKLINGVHLILYTYNRKPIRRVLLNKILYPIDTIYITYFLYSIFFE
ncbi:hypothetical protein AV545_03620 [Paenibacillus jamilae]|nr:hypothetical protein AV545_03620 [Paenibacillus jamilae]